LGMLKFNDDSGAAHWRVLEYLYTGDYSDDISNNFEGKAALKVNVLGILRATRRPPLLKDPRVYALADMFFLDDLKALSTAKLQLKLQDLWTSDLFPECIREIYASTPDSDRAMRAAVVEVASVRIHELGMKAIFKDLIREGGDFAVEYFESTIFPEPPSVPKPLRKSSG